MSSASTPHSSATPQDPSRSSESPQPSSSTNAKLAKTTGSTRHKPTNVFSNDGSFLERFQRSKKEEEERKKAEDDAKRKRQFEDRFKKRGKRPTPDTSESHAADDQPSKKFKTDKDKDAEKDKPPLTQYEKELRGYASRSLKDDGMGIRPLVK